jgi:bifunctional DNA-binding transcriptional regulator/antitoxin component of YhaV-PrlF toxin-antitoxin module
MTVTATIRQRGQLTIPDLIRKKFSWLKENAVVSIAASSGGEVIIKPLIVQGASDKPNWNEIWRRIYLTRSFRGRTKDKSLSQFIVEDRLRH